MTLHEPCCAVASPDQSRGRGGSGRLDGGRWTNADAELQGRRKEDLLSPPNTPIVVYVPGDKSDLTPGAKVFIAAIKQPDGTLQGRAWRVGRDGVTPPM
jgi:hypothetical protein